MARPTIGDRPMTAAERMRRHRERKKNPDPLPDDPMQRRIHGKTNAQAARFLQCSPRHYYTIMQYHRYKAFDWDGDIFNGKFGRCGMSFIADVCKYGNAETQREIHDMIKTDGANFARRVWRYAKAEDIQG